MHVTIEESFFFVQGFGIVALAKKSNIIGSTKRGCPPQTKKGYISLIVFTWIYQNGDIPSNITYLGKT